VIHELLAKKKALVDEARAIQDRVYGDQNQEWRGDDEAKFDELTTKAEGVTKEIERLARLDAQANSLDAANASQGRRSEPTQQKTEQARRGNGTVSRIDQAETLRGWLMPGHMRTDAMRASAARTGVALDSKEFTFKLPAVALRSERQADVQEWRRANDEYRAAFGSGSNSIGGYTVPDAMMQSLEVAQLAYSNIRSVCRVVRTDGGGPLPFPTVNDTGNKGVLLAENTQVSETEPSFGQLQLDAFKFSSKAILVSVEFLQDTSIDAPSEIGRMLGERIGRITNDYFTTGTGSSQPKGVVAAATDSTVTAASATLYTHDELLDLIHSVDPAYRDSSRFMLPDSALKNLQKIKVLQYSGDTVGMPLWRPGLTDGAPNTILGYPYVINQSMAAPGSGNKDMLFGDFSKYIIRDVRDVVLIRLDERYADYHQVGFLAFSRSDGDLLDAGTHPISWADHT
jgi:HK97 family phage major capsid protein